ncbi:hypothetical protein TIFTF001_025472 [Ficus carica]|uniref:Uncharacterized protein n=1 Tax=Ficus carica TaxID=3494 RepID=A0AA88DGM8_FICCA|nr:hypothetical protein TIFTF001_025472 [Ficus carica]
MVLSWGLELSPSSTVGEEWSKVPAGGGGWVQTGVREEGWMALSWYGASAAVHDG